MTIEIQTKQDPPTEPIRLVIAQLSSPHMSIMFSCFFLPFLKIEQQNNVKPNSQNSEQVHH